MTAYLTLTSDDVPWRACANVLYERTKDPVFIDHKNAGRPLPLDPDHLQSMLNQLADKYRRVLRFYAEGYCGTATTKTTGQRRKEARAEQRYQRMLMERSKPIRDRLAQLTGHPTYFSILAITKCSDCIHLVNREDRAEFCKLLNRYNGYCTASRES